MPQRRLAGCEALSKAGARGGLRWATSVGLSIFWVATSAWASSVDVRCPKLPATDSEELQARARLLLSSTGHEAIQVGVACDESGAWLVWTDGSRTAIDVRSGIVEGALDAIESRLSAGRGRRDPSTRDKSVPPPAATGAVQSSGDALEPPSHPGEKGEPVPDTGDGQALPASSEGRSPAGARGLLEGGVSVGTTTELWSGSSPLGLGLRIDVGVGFGEQFAVVIGQAARIALPVPAAGEITVYDLQGGLAFGAPYRSRTGFGVLLLGGAERLAVSDSGFGSTGFWVWAVTTSLGARASIQAGAIDLWLGADLLVRSASLDVRGSTVAGPTVAGVPAVSGSLSIGCFFPAFTRETAAQLGSRNE